MTQHQPVPWWGWGDAAATVLGRLGQPRAPGAQTRPASRRKHPVCGRVQAEGRLPGSLRRSADTRARGGAVILTPHPSSREGANSSGWGRGGASDSPASSSLDAPHLDAARGPRAATTRGPMATPVRPLARGGRRQPGTPPPPPPPQLSSRPQTHIRASEAPSSKSETNPE